MLFRSRERIGISLQETQLAEKLTVLETLRLFRSFYRNGQDPDELQSSIDIVLRRFAEYHALEGAFGRRAVTERAKGILMERHGIDEQAAFNMLREHARRHNRKMVDVAEEVVDTHQLLPGAAQLSPPRRPETPD